MKICAIIPTYNNPGTIRSMAAKVASHIPDVIVVDDGSNDAEAALAIGALEEEAVATVVRRPRNGGKGAAVIDGLREAARRGFTHALQIDADGQHEVADIPKLVGAARDKPDALVLASPRFSHEAPKGRMIGRKITLFWTRAETSRGVIDDPMCGFRVYPVEAALAVKACGRRMDFDPEIAVLLHWAGHPIVNVATPVRYVPREEGGVSHFRLLHDNLLISWMHSRLMFRKITGFFLRPFLR